MTTQQDAQLGFKKETTFGTVVTVDSFLEPTEVDFAWNPTFAAGAGMRVARRVQAADRRVLVKEEPTGTFSIEPLTKGIGKLLEAAFGVGTSTNIAGASYQQVFTPATTDYLDSYTFQVGVPPLGGGTTLPQTFPGMVCTGFEFTAGNASVPTFKFNWIGKSVTAGESLATASYASGTQLFSFIHASITIGGTVTVPTTTALASGGTAVGNISDFSLTYENGLDANGFNFGSQGQRSRKSALGERVITGSLTAEFDSATLRDAYLAQTDLALVFTLATTTAISGSNYPTIQFTIPNIRLEGELPKPNAGDVVTLAIDFTGLDNRTSTHPIYAAVVTAETAI